MSRRGGKPDSLAAKGAAAKGAGGAKGAESAKEDRPTPATSGDPDAALVEAAQRGSRDAFQKLLTRYQHRVYNLAFRTLRDHQAAEEASQEAFVSIYRHIGRFRGGARFTSWMYRIVINQCRTRLRHRKRRPDITTHNRIGPGDGEDGSTATDLPDRRPQADPERVASANQRLALAQKALDELDDEHRTVILLRDVEDLNYAEIAEILGLPEGTVKSRIHRARNHLKERLSKYLEGA